MMYFLDWWDEYGYRLQPCADEEDESFVRHVAAESWGAATGSLSEQLHESWKRALHLEGENKRLRTEREWRQTSVKPDDGESVWLVVREWDGVNFHIDYGQVFADTDGLQLRRFEGVPRSNEYCEAWPPKDVIAWMPCNVPEYDEGGE